MGVIGDWLKEKETVVSTIGQVAGVIAASCTWWKLGGLKVWMFVFVQ